MKFNVKRYFQTLGVLLGVVLIAAFIFMGMDFSPGDIDETDIDNTSTVAAENGKINVLLMGTDVDGLRTDAIMLVSYDAGTKQVTMMSIPRDTKMYIGNRYQKINAAHAYVKDGVIGGPTATCEAVTRLTGIPINYYVDFSFDAVAHVVDELGPIDFTIPDLYGDGVGMVYDDPVQGLHINLPPGDYQLNGQQAVWVMRYRHGNVDPDTGVFKGYTNGDEDRVAMQQKLIKAIIDQKLNASLILKIPAIFNDISKEIKTNLTFSDVVKYSKYLAGFSSTGIQTVSLPGSYDTDKEIGDVWVVNLSEVRTMVQENFGYSADHITTGNPNDPESYNWDKKSSPASSSKKSSSEDD